MSRFTYFKEKIKTSFRRINLVDRALILFMIILLIQSAYSLFTTESNTKEIHSIDTIIRTSSAAIFGYFISANFVRKSFTRNQEMSQTTERNQQIVTNTGVNEKIERTNRMQVMIATGIGLFCLAVLLVVRNAAPMPLNETSASMLATMAQFRDFISGCIGFLIGSSKNGSDGR